MLINADALHVVVTVAKYKSFASAAQHLYKVPTAVSYTVRKLEDSLGVKLFDRDGKYLVLTQAGKYFLSKGELILNELESLRVSTMRISAGFEAELRISINNIVSIEPLLPLIAESENLFPQTEIRIVIDVHNGVWDALLGKRADIAIAAPSQMMAGGGIACKEMGDVEWDFAVSPNHPLAAESAPLSAAKLRQYPAICVADTSVRLEPKVAWRLRGQKAIIAPDFMHKIRMHIAGLGVGFLPRYFCQPYVEQGLLVTKVVEEPKQHTPLFLAWHCEASGPCFSWWLTQLQRSQIKDLWTKTAL